MHQGRLRKSKDNDHYVYIVEGVSDGRVVRHTSFRMSENEAREHLKQTGYSDAEIDAELLKAGRGAGWKH